MEEMYCCLAKKIAELTEQNEETDVSTLAMVLSMKYGEVQKYIQEMDEKGWILTYEIDMCCGSEYVVTGLTEEGKQAFFK